ncbi:16S rRNA (adenine(1518)-N(6)/adenine(1519)-N(6))-dimethyltransferase, partial [bacterium]|nr:16S rRNA (adenine(1518)-N(6)/adenine(1519)-N(6))-dimethyltransferase [bacterium]
QVNCVPKRLFNITPQSFIPKPKVTSTVVFLDFETKSNYQVKNYDLFSKLVKLAFQKRRKTIKNALSSLDGINTILDKAKIEKTLRPENLQIIDFIRLSEIASRSNTW